jgi:hypothetical protein
MAQNIVRKSIFMAAAVAVSSIGSGFAWSDTKLAPMPDLGQYTDERAAEDVTPLALCIRDACVRKTMTLIDACSEIESAVPDGKLRKEACLYRANDRFKTCAAVQCSTEIVSRGPYRVPYWPAR